LSFSQDLSSSQVPQIFIITDFSGVGVVVGLVGVGVGVGVGVVVDSASVGVVAGLSGVSMVVDLAGSDHHNSYTQFGSINKVKSKANQEIKDSEKGIKQSNEKTQKEFDNVKQRDQNNKLHQRKCRCGGRFIRCKYGGRFSRCQCGGRLQKRTKRSSQQLYPIWLY
jgi:hypothetical protein